MNMKEALSNYFRAAYPCIAIQTTEEQRAVADVMDAAKVTEKGFVVWSATEGMRAVLPNPKTLPDTEDLLAACRQRVPDTVYCLLDAHTWPFDRDPILTRSFKDLLSWAPANGSCVVLVSASYKPHPTFERMVTILDYTLPSKDDLRKISRGIAESAGQPDLPITDDIIRALGGLSTTEAENALALSMVATSTLDPSVVYAEKTAAVKRSGLLEIVEPDPRGLDAIGGLDNLKAWITKRKRAYTPEAEQYGLPTPKGILLVGVPGTGKSLSAKAVGTALGVPTVRLDIGALFNSLVGESEARTRDALKLAEAVSPCVLWVDEIDKGMAGSAGSGSGDSGVTKRVFGTIISWMQERRRPVFLVCTANDVTALPPELLRKGRFDEIFAVDLPSFEERSAIFAIHLSKRGRNPLTMVHPGIIEATEGFTGSEIENVVEEALFNGFDEGTEITGVHLLAAARSTVPLSVTAKEQIERIRSWAQSRARFASTPTTSNNGATPATGKRRLTA